MQGVDGLHFCRGALRITTATCQIANQLIRDSLIDCGQSKGASCVLDVEQFDQIPLMTRSAAHHGFGDTKIVIQWLHDLESTAFGAGVLQMRTGIVASHMAHCVQIREQRC